MHTPISSGYLRASVTLAILGVIAEIVGVCWTASLNGIGGYMPASWKFAQLWQSAAHIQLIHSLVLYFLATKGRKSVWYAMFAGIIGFSGGSYMQATTGLEISGIIFGFGAPTLVVAWAALALGDL